MPCGWSARSYQCRVRRKTIKRRIYRSGLILRARALHNSSAASGTIKVPKKVKNMLKHNTYFDGQVQSVGFERNSHKATVGVIAPGDYHFNTGAAERMTVVSGLLRAKVTGGEWVTYPAGTYFEIAAKSGFDVQAVGGPAAYLCEFLGE
jgi:uncharacterized protein YaiE (UPF0345 family)